MTLYIGLMSGTSMDGIDAALVDTTNHRLITGLTLPYSIQTKKKLSQILETPKVDLKSLAVLNSELGKAFGYAALAVMEKAGCTAKDIIAIGSHGQTVFHDPFSEIPTTMQLGCAHQIAEITGLPVVADFRTRDMVLGGQGAPLAPLYHQILFSQEAPAAIVNIGGIANITLLISGQPPIGYDVGPGNVLLDAWHQQHHHEPYDKDGQFALRGKVIDSLSQDLYKDSFFHKKPPKSIGKEYFLNILSLPELKEFSPADVQATFVWLTAKLIADAVNNHKPKTMLICGGGVHNKALMQAITSLLPECEVQSTANKGLSPDFLEAMMFAWLAEQYIENSLVDLMHITGSSKPVRLGVYYPAG